MIYSVNRKPLLSILPKNVAAIDFGVNNLITVTFNTGIESLIIPGKPLKSINQYYNKKVAVLKSDMQLLHNRFTSKRIKNLSMKRNFKIRDYLHKASRILVNHLVFNDIDTLVIGYNPNWKQDINLGSVNNQNFVNIPFYKLKKMLTYKFELEGGTVIEQEESYTSKCSFMDNELVQKHTVYQGKRLCRGLFKTSTGHLINADVNGSANILIKAIPKAFPKIGDRTCVAQVTKVPLL